MTPLYDLAVRLNVVANYAFCPRNGQTFCNDYASVFCAARGVVLPPVVADDQLGYLSTSPEWTEIGKLEAVTRANAGQLVLAVADSATLKQNHGHIVALVESPDTNPSGCFVTAAGARNAVRCPLDQQFGAIQPRFFVSDVA